MGMLDDEPKKSASYLAWEAAEERAGDTPPSSMLNGVDDRQPEIDERSAEIQEDNPGIDVAQADKQAQYEIWG